MMQRDREGVEIVPLRRYHLEEIAEIETLCFSVPWTRDMLAQELTTPLSRYFIFEERGRVLGYVGTRMLLDECHITNVAVHPDFQRQGIATLLLKELESYVRKEGLILMTLEVRRSNAPAIAFYQGLGFALSGIRRGYYEDPVEDALLMTKLFSEEEDESC